MLQRNLLMGILPFATYASAAFGVTANDGSIVVDAGSSNPFLVTFDTASCDITSLLYRGDEYQFAGKKSHIGSGLGTAAVSYETDGDIIKVSCVADNERFDLTQYFVFVEGESNIYMGTYTNSEPEVGELRFLFRLTDLPYAYPFGEVSWTAGSSETIEGSDVFVVDGETRSKFYSSERFIDDDVYCAQDQDGSVHACFVKWTTRSNEKSSGGPFFRDIDLNFGGDYQSLSNYMNSGHVQTEAFRQGFHGPYAFSMSRNGIPTASALDYTFLEDLDLQGYVGEQGRGTVSGQSSGTDSSMPTVLHWYNDDYQYWQYADSSGGFTSPAMVEGTYTMVLYQDELKAATKTVEVTAGATTAASIDATNPIITEARNTIFQIGEYDGQPFGFRNADKFLRMHPADTRMDDWAPGPFAVGSSAEDEFPMAIFQAVNSPQTIDFDLDAAVDGAVFRIATTLAFAGARPSVTVNDYDCGTPAAPTKIDSRGVTRGAYRGYGEVYSCDIPAGTLVAGGNTIEISAASGSGSEGFLSANFIFDAVELYTID